MMINILLSWKFIVLIYVVFIRRIKLLMRVRSFRAMCIFSWNLNALNKMRLCKNENKNAKISCSANSERSLISLPFHFASQRFRGNGKWAQRQLCIYVPFEPIQFQHIWGNFHSASAVVADFLAHTRCSCSGCHTLSA